MSLGLISGDKIHQNSRNKKKSYRKSLRILVAHRYYWPDTPPYASLLRRIVERWTQDGHKVDVLSSQPSYKVVLQNQRCPRIEIVNGISIQRLSLPSETGRQLVRIINALRICVAVLWKAILHRYDVIMVSTLPPVIIGATASLVAMLTGARFIYHCMDIHPEVGQISGEFSHPYVFKLLGKIDNFTCKQADPVIVLSRDMENTLRQRFGGNRFKIQVLNNFSLPSEKTIPNNLPFNIEKERLLVLFAGNIGRFQGLDSVVEAMAKIKDRDNIEFIFMGEGTAKASLQQKSKAVGARIRFIEHQPVEIAKSLMRHVHAGFVSLAPGIYNYSYPSKTMTYLEQGCPLIVAVEPESELATDVERRHYGYCVPINDSQALSELLIRLSEDLSWHPKMKQTARQIAQTTFSEAIVLDNWSNIINFNNKKAFKH